jgi:hypothetical protein
MRRMKRREMVQISLLAQLLPLFLRNSSSSSFQVDIFLLRTYNMTQSATKTVGLDACARIYVCFEPYSTVAKNLTPLPGFSYMGLLFPSIPLQLFCPAP